MTFVLYQGKYENAYIARSMQKYSVIKFVL